MQQKIKNLIILIIKLGQINRLKNTSFENLTLEIKYLAALQSFTEKRS